MKHLSRLALIIALPLGLLLAIPELPVASASPNVEVCKKKKKKKKKYRKKRHRRSHRARRAQARRSKARRSRARRASARRTRTPRVTAKTIKRWQRKGYSNDEIVRLARLRGYEVTKRERRRLRKYRVRKSLRIALIRGPKNGEAETTRIDLDKVIDPNDIDFDSVPPPDGIPPEYASQSKAPETKKLNTSLRPSAPFEAKSKAATKRAAAPAKRGAKKPLRRVIVASSDAEND